MQHDLFEQLAQTDVPPVPEQLEIALHERLNRRLLSLHVADVLLRALPLAVMHFAAAVGHLVRLTVTGRSPAADPFHDRKRRGSGPGSRGEGPG